MGASLSVKLTQTGKNETARTATVSVSVTITSNKGTHNHFGSSELGNGAYLTGTVDGKSFGPVYVSFGSEGQEEVETPVYSNSFTVSYGSSGTKTVSARVSCVTETSAGTISNSASLSLSPISSSGGSSGGDSGGGDDDDNTEEWDPDNPGSGSGGSTGTIDYNATVHLSGGFNLSSGDAFSVKFTSPEFLGTSKGIYIDLIGVENGGSPYIGIALCTSDANLSKYKNTSALPDDEYRLENVYSMPLDVVGIEQEIPTNAIMSNTDYYLIFWYEDASFSVDEVKVGVAWTNDSSGGDDSGGSGDDYVEYFEADATVDGQVSITKAMTNPPYSTTTSGMVRYSSSSLISIIKFTTPEFDGISDGIRVALSGVSYNYDGLEIGAAICDSDANNGLYFNATSTVDDPNQLDCSITPGSWVSEGIVDLYTTELKSQTTYYLMLWIPTDLNPNAQLNFGKSPEHSITFYYTKAADDDGGDNEIQLVRGVFYIDNGVSWDKYECYIDDGENWIPIEYNGSYGASTRIDEGEVPVSSRELTVNCGFKPDVVYLTAEITYDNVLSCCCFDFYVANQTELVSCLVHSNDAVAKIFAYATADGFDLYLSGSGTSYLTTLKYAAVKYT